MQSSRIVGGPHGEILEVHVVASSERNPKQIVRDVESMIVSKLGSRLDHRKISVAQIEPDSEAVAGVAGPRRGAEVGEAAQGTAYRAPGSGRVGFVGLSMSQTGPHAQARVELSADGVETVGTVVAADCAGTVLRTLAEATVQAVRQLFDGESAFAVTAVDQITIGGTPVVVVGVGHVDEETERTLVGACPIDRDAQRSVALATLDAVNRVSGGLRLREHTEYEIGPASGG